MQLEIIRTKATSADANKRSIIFVHGSYCGAWIWRENFIPYFAEKGRSSVAFSFRGHGESEGMEELNSHSLADYAEDLDGILKQTIEETKKPPIIIAHSMGAKVTEMVLGNHPDIPAVVLMAPVSPYGLMSSMVSMAMKSPLLLWRMNMMQTFGSATNLDFELISKGLFSNELEEEKKLKYAAQFTTESLRAAGELFAQGFFWHKNTPFPPSLVIGGDDDLLIPVSDLRNTSIVYDSELQIINNANHVLMLDTCWTDVADRILTWLDKHEV